MLNKLKLLHLYHRYERVTFIVQLSLGYKDKINIPLACKNFFFFFPINVNNVAIMVIELVEI